MDLVRILSLLSVVAIHNVVMGATNTLIFGVPVTGTINGNSRDFYEFTAQAGDRISVSMGKLASNTSFEPTISVLGAEGVVLTEATAEGNLWMPSVLLTNSGTFYLLCRDGNGTTGTAGGGYSLTMVRFPGSNEVDAGESGTIAPGQTRTGSVNNTDLDVYEITAQAGDRISVVVQETPADLDFEPSISVYDRNGPICSTTHQSGASRFLTGCLSAAGTYYVLVRDTNGIGGGNYSLRINLLTESPATNAPPEFLQVTECCGNVIVRWSTNATDFRLQTTELLGEPASSTVWSNVPPPYEESGRYFVFTNSIPPLKKFFRLVSP